MNNLHRKLIQPTLHEEYSLHAMVCNALKYTDFSIITGYCMLAALGQCYGIDDVGRVQLEVSRN